MSTPAPPPVPLGLSLPQDFPPLAAPQAPPPALSKPQKKATGPSASASVITPVIPVKPSQATKVVGAGTIKDGPSQPVVPKEDLPTQSTSTTAIEPVPKLKPRKEAPPSDSMASRGPKNTTKPGHTAATGDEEKLTGMSGMTEGLSNNDSSASRKRHPAKLNIEAAKSRAEETKTADMTEASGPVKNGMPASSTTTSAVSQPQTPMTAVSQASAAASAKNGQLRTIRVMQTPKNETASKASAAAVAKDGTNVASAIPSRRGSLSSLNPPGTPASERISDNVSLTSTSMSRADSPPPSKVGTAPARHTSKSQQKKERQTRAKQAEQSTKPDEAPAKPPVEEPVQAPIIGRKKKQKKAASRGTADSTPAASRPSSPVPHGESIPEQDEPLPTTPSRDGKKDEGKAAPESEVENPLSPAATSSADQPQKNTLNAATLFAQLQRSNDVPPGALDIFKPVIGLNHRFDVDPQSLENQMPEVSLGLPPPLTDARTIKSTTVNPSASTNPTTNESLSSPTAAPSAA